MGPYQGRGRIAADTLRSNHASPGGRTWARLCRWHEGTTAEPLRPRIGVRDLARERGGFRAVAVLAGLFRALDPWRGTLRFVADDDPADRDQRDRAVDPGAGLRQLQQSWRSPGADQGAPIRGIPASVWHPDSRDRAVGSGAGGCRQRPV